MIQEACCLALQPAGQAQYILQPSSDCVFACLRNTHLTLPCISDAMNLFPRSADSGERNGGGYFERLNNKTRIMRTYRTPILIVTLLVAGAALADLAQSPSSTSQQAAPPQTAASVPATLMQPFTSMDGRFSAFFPGAPAQSSQAIQLQNGEATTLYEFSANADNGSTSYIVLYNDYAPDVVADGAQALLQQTENAALAGKTLVTDAAIDLHGVPGRAYTATDSNGYNYTVHEFLAGTRFYQLVVTTSKGSTTAQINQFMNSFIIL